jgi:hypothetical protein
MHARLKYDSGQETDLRIYRSGAKYMMERRDLKPGVLGTRQLEPVDMATAFDGTQHQVLNVRDGVLKLVRHRPAPLAPDICLFPYLWLVVGQDVPWGLESLRNQDVWQHCFSGAALQGMASVREYECQKVRLSVPVGRLKNNFFVVYFAPKLGMYPIRYKRFGGPKARLSTTCDVMSVRTYRQDGALCIVPTHVLYEETCADGVSTPMSFEILADAESIGVNMPIADDVFTISKDRAKLVLDVGRISDELTRSVKPASLEPVTQRLGRTVAIVAGAAILVIFVVVGGIRRRRRMASQAVGRT